MARKNQRQTTSDWMELERKRGISISSTVLQFDYNGFRINLLDTPGHQDFSEDTYRVLTAVDAVVMVIDAAKGIETQTKKLFEVCRTAPYSDLHVHEQTGPADKGPTGVARRAGTCATNQGIPDELAPRHRI